VCGWWVRFGISSQFYTIDLYKSTREAHGSVYARPLLFAFLQIDYSVYIFYPQID
jgi:hypothetical protein